MSEYIITQEIINKLQQHRLEKRRNDEFVYDRKIHNEFIQSVIYELSEYE